MRSSDQPQPEAGFIATVALLLIVCLLLVWSVSCLAQRSVENQLLQEQLLARLQQELPAEVRRLDAQARTAGAVAPPQTLQAQALINLYERGRREMLALEEQREVAKALVIVRVDARKELRMLGLAVRRAKMWLMMLEAQLESMPQVKRVEVEGRDGEVEFVLAHA